MSKKNTFMKVDKEEMQFPDTKCITDMEPKVFQGIVIQCISKIKGVSLLGGKNLMDNLLSRDSDKVKGIHIDLEDKKRSLSIKVELNIEYGMSIPEKAQEVQAKIIEAIVDFTKLHVSNVHVVFKNVVSCGLNKKD